MKKHEAIIVVGSGPIGITAARRPDLRSTLGNVPVWLMFRNKGRVKHLRHIRHELSHNMLIKQTTYNFLASRKRRVIWLKILELYKF